MAEEKKIRSPYPLGADMFPAEAQDEYRRIYEQYHSGIYKLTRELHDEIDALYAKHLSKTVEKGC